MLDTLRKRKHRRTRVWVTISARRVDPAELLELLALDSHLRIGESIAFDGASTALELRLDSVAAHHAPRAPLSLDARDRELVARLLARLASEPTIQDIILESHVGGTEDVDRVNVLSLDALAEHVVQDRLVAAVRYITDRDRG